MNLPSLLTERCELRPWTGDDVDELHGLLADASVRRYLCDDIIFSHEQVTAFISTHLTLVATQRVGMWFVQLRGSGTVAGFAGFRLIDESPDLELMYALYPAYWGRGFATEASKAVLEYLWLETAFERVFARTDPPNVQST
jgi:[ribosomal protein S5]-alanine N-acetyltransferase